MLTIEKNMKTFVISVLAVLLVPVFSMAMRVSPKEVDIGATFNGRDILVTGDVAQDEEVIIQVIGSDTQAEFKEKGKVAGILWMTVAHLSISGVPSAFFVYLPATISSWREVDDKRWLELDLDYGSLLKTMRVEPQGMDENKVFTDFLRLKTADDLYQMVNDGVSYKNSENGQREFKAKIHIPPKMPIDSYTIRVVKVNKGIVSGQEEVNLRVKQVGFPLFISNMAYNNSIIYGVLAVLIAIGAGLLMGTIFKDRGGAH